MTQDRRVEPLLDAWFADGPSMASDRVLDDVAARISRQSQRPKWRLQPRRFPAMSSPTRVILLTGALLAAIVGGAILVSGGGSSTPTPTPTPTGSPSAVYPRWFTQQGDGAGILPAGSTATRRFLGGSTLTVPEGWVNDADNAQNYSLFPDSPANQAQYALSQETAENVILAATVANNMFAICDATGLFQGATASEVIDAVVANEALTTTEPVDVTIGGLRGRQVDVRLRPEWPGTCRLGPEAQPPRDYQDARNRIIVLDRPDAGTIGIAIGSMTSADFEAFLVDAMPIVESLGFDLGSGASPSPSPRPSPSPS